MILQSNHFRNFFNVKEFRSSLLVSVLTFLKSDFLKNAGKLFGSSTITQIMALLVVTPLLSRLYAPELHGDITTFLSILAIGASIATLKYDQAIMVEEDRNRAISLVKLASLINVAFLIVSHLSLFLVGSKLAHIMGFNSVPMWFYFIPITIFLTAMIDIYTVWWNREKEYNKLSSNRIITFGTSSGYKLLHGFLKFGRPNGMILGHAIGQLFSTLLFTPKTIFKHLHVTKGELVKLSKKYRSFPGWAMPSSLINVLGTHLPVFLVLYFFDRETNGHYGNAMKLTYLPMTAVSYAISQVLFERLARIRSSKAESINLSLQILYFLFFLAFIPVVVMLTWGDVITPFILGESWEMAGQMTQIVVLFCFAMYLSSPFSVAFEVYSKLNLQFIYTTIFTALTALAMYITLQITQDIYMGLLAFSFTGVVVRLAMLVSCFRLIGYNVIAKILFGLAIIVGLSGLGYATRYGL